MPHAGADPHRVAQQLRTKLLLNAAVMQLPIGLEDRLSVRIYDILYLGPQNMLLLCGIGNIRRPTLDPRNNPASVSAHALQATGQG